MSDRETLFSVKDPRGYVVSLSKERYDSHIIGESGHVDVPHQDIRSAVEKPYVIYNSARFEGRQLYFAKCSSVHPPLYVKVAAEMNEPQKTGEVVTAFLSKKVGGGIDEEKGPIYIGYSNQL